ncbi:MAG: ABC transporter, permease protein 1 (cluster 1, maltose/g3p/polyamine/iron) [uncultured Nocardioidaceae bacterium]|uniref:ABC transporter, permease protein 1 (Cluster 1, maltose/g3p/polyamine/iron) n=1 Tax=uncultured Nocardioidaceae bacterium TaxID=253824 RepID=A0A6J4LKE6_9ACTN|nr:MAG: ABC transporter, permease protein 1 (cluster 1, maltose/g3p/polyamine/iron) [uncultured Nocardioidaceae bacterium]
MTTAAPQTPVPPAPGPARGQGRPTQAGSSAVTRKAQARLGMLLVTPLMVLTAVFLVFPMANAAYYVFVDFNGIDPSPPWIGLSNFTELAQDPDVWAAFKNNVIWIVVGTTAPLVVGLAFALLVWTVHRGSRWYRLAFFFPYVLPQVAVGVVWGWIYEPSRGWLNRALEFVGLGSFTRGWLGDPDTALYAVLGTAVWTAAAFVFIIVLSALRNVDADLMDAARLDGTNSFQRLVYVIIPQIMPVFLMVTTITLLGGFSVFDIIFVMTGGGPAGATDVLGTYAYSSAFQLNRISYGTTLALIITVLAIPFAVMMNRLQRRLSLQGMGA